MPDEKKGRGQMPAMIMLRFGDLYFDGGQIGNYKVLGGADIHKTIRDAIDLASIDPTGSVSFDFNDVHVTVEPNSDPTLILRDWKRAINGCIDRVRPHPAATLSAQEVKRDRLILLEAARQRRREMKRGQ